MIKIEDGIRLPHGSILGPEVVLQGNLSKWTNYIHGWQRRFFVLKPQGHLVYFKSEVDQDYGCRGSLSLKNARIEPHEFDDLRFDVSVGDCSWYLRASSVEDRQKWVQTLKSLSTASLSTLLNGPSYPDSYSAKKQEFRDKLKNLETLGGIMREEVQTLEKLFDNVVCVEGSEAQARNQSAKHDLKGHIVTFKETNNAFLSSVSQFLPFLNELEHCLFDTNEVPVKHQEKGSIEKKPHTSLDSPPPNPDSKMDVPDFEEGPHSQIGEDEFFDAVEQALDKLEEEQKCYDDLRKYSKHEEDTISPAERQHPLWSEIDEVTNEQLHYARLLPGKDGVWELFAEEGNMRMYKREEEKDGLVVDPLKALHEVRGITAREICHYFFSPEFRMEWETTLDQARVVETVSPNTLIFHQLHKRIWPAAQRDACFWSHFRKVDKSLLPEGAHDTYLVCNKSSSHPDAPPNMNGTLRVDLVVTFVCDTCIDERARNLPLDKVTRKDISCRITYCSVINPGGWAPASVLRSVYKREYPRFLKRFTKYVQDKTSSRPIEW